MELRHAPDGQTAANRPSRSLRGNRPGTDELNHAGTGTDSLRSTLDSRSPDRPAGPVVAAETDAAKPQDRPVSGDPPAARSGGARRDAGPHAALAPDHASGAGYAGDPGAGAAAAQPARRTARRWADHNSDRQWLGRRA